MNKARILDDKALDTLFREARTHKAWTDETVTDVLIQAVYDLMKWGPTSGNCCPARFVFVKSKEAKERLKPHLDAGNVDKTMSAPVTAIIAYDKKFYEQLSKLSPHAKDPAAGFRGNDKKIMDAATQNGTLQGAYFMLAARSLGLDCGPMGGFNAKGINEEFLKDADWEVNFLCNMGYGDASKLFPRAPRLSFDETSKII